MSKTTPSPTCASARPLTDSSASLPQFRQWYSMVVERSGRSFHFRIFQVLIRQTLISFDVATQARALSNSRISSVRFPVVLRAFCAASLCFELRISAPDTNAVLHALPHLNPLSARSRGVTFDLLRIGFRLRFVGTIVQEIAASVTVSATRSSVQTRPATSRAFRRRGFQQLHRSMIRMRHPGFSDALAQRFSEQVRIACESSTQMMFFNESSVERLNFKLSGAYV